MSIIHRHYSTLCQHLINMSLYACSIRNQPRSRTKSVGLIVLYSVPPGRLVGEWSTEAPIPGLVPLRAIPSAARRCPALARCHPGGKAICHCGIGRPRLWNLHPGFGPLQTPPKYQVWRLDLEPVHIFFFFFLLTNQLRQNLEILSLRHQSLAQKWWASFPRLNQ